MRSVIAIDELQIELGTADEMIEIIRTLHEVEVIRLEHERAMGHIKGEPVSEEYEASFDKYMESVRKLRLSFMDRETNSRRLELLLRTHEKILTASDIVFYAGMVFLLPALWFMFAGFKNWRVKVQDPLDELLKMRVEAAKLDKNNTLDT